MTFKIGSGRPILSSVFHIFACPWTSSSLNSQRAICVGYCDRRAAQNQQTHVDNVMLRTYRKFRVLSVLIGCDAYCGLQRPRQIAFFRVHVQQFCPWFDRIPGSVQRPLVRFLRLLLMMKPQTEVAENLPFQARLAIRHVLRFEVRDFRTENRPDA